MNNELIKFNSRIMYQMMVLMIQVVSGDIDNPFQTLN